MKNKQTTIYDNILIIELNKEISNHNLDFIKKNEEFLIKQFNSNLDFKNFILNYIQLNKNHTTTIYLKNIILNK